MLLLNFRAKSEIHYCRCCWCWWYYSCCCKHVLGLFLHLHVHSGPLFDHMPLPQYCFAAFQWVSQPPLLFDHRSSNNSLHFDLYHSHVGKAPARKQRQDSLLFGALSAFLQGSVAMILWICHCVPPTSCVIMFQVKLECHLLSVDIKPTPRF